MHEISYLWVSNTIFMEICELFWIKFCLSIKKYYGYVCHLMESVGQIMGFSLFCRSFNGKCRSFNDTKALF